MAAEQALSVVGASLPNHGFGGTGRLSLSGDLAAVGAPGAEAVYLYRRNLTATDGGVVNGSWGDRPYDVLGSSDFDYDVLHLKESVHRQVRPASRCGDPGGPTPRRPACSPLGNAGWAVVSVGQR